VVPLLALGLGLFVLGLVWTAWMVLAQAWPSVLPWLVVAVGGLLTAVALQRRGARHVRLVWALLGGAIAAVLFGWLLG
jgi:hypothetical protein